jgi:branched-chain amino acid transport system permease protein
VLQFVTIGLFQGAVYGLVAVGLVLVYKGSRVFNFAQGEVGTAAAYIAWSLWSLAGLPLGLAVLVGLVAAVLLGLLIERLVVRPMFEASRISVLVALIGVALLIIGIEVVVGKPEARILDPLIPGFFVFLDTAIEWQQLLALGALGAVAALMALFFRTNAGLAVLAVSQDATATRIMGISVKAMSRLIWVLAALLAGLAGILQASIDQLTPAMMTRTSLVPAFTAAVLGGMTSLPGAFLGGILVGVAQNVGIYAFGSAGTLLQIPGAPELLVFSMLLLVLLIRPQGIFGREA